MRLPVISACFVCLFCYVGDLERLYPLTFHWDQWRLCIVEDLPRVPGNTH